MKPRVKSILYEAKFTSNKVATASGVSIETFRSWFGRGVLSVDEKNIGVDAAEVGLPRLFSGYTAMLAAIMGQLKYLPTAEAKKAALSFAAISVDERKACYLYKQGLTLLVVARSDAGEFIARVINVGDHQKGSKKQTESTWPVLWNYFPPETKLIVAVLEIDELWQSVFQRLGIRAELEATWD